MKKFLNYFKNKYQIESNFQLAVIFVVFAVTGSSAVWVRKYLFSQFDIPYEDNILVKIFLIFPIYQVLLIIIGTLFGQFKFFWQFEKNMMKRFMPWKRNQPD